MTVSVILRENSPVVEYESTIDFHEIGRRGVSQPQVNFFVPVGYRTDRFRYDVPFGTVDRGPIAHDVPGNSFVVPLPDKGPALLLTTDTKYGYRGWENAVSVDLIRGSYEPDPYPEYGQHHIRIGVGILKDAAEDTIFRVNEAFQHAALPVCSARRRKGTWPMDASFMQIDGPVHLSALKTPEYEDGVIVRLGSEADYAGPFKLTFCREVAEARLLDITERKTIGTAKVKGKTVGADIDAYGIRTVLVRFK